MTDPGKEICYLLGERTEQHLAWLCEQHKTLTILLTASPADATLILVVGEVESLAARSILDNETRLKAENPTALLLIIETLGYETHEYASVQDAITDYCYPYIR